jgi:vitamin B12 transporter
VLGWSGEQGPHAWQLSARHDHNSQYGDQPTAAAAYGYEFSPGWRAGASIGSTFSAPTFNDLYYPDRSSNPNMPPQEGVSKELSLTRVLEQGRWRMAYYRNDVRGYIQSTTTQVLSTPHVRMEGLTLSADQDWDTAWGLWGVHGSADWLNAFDQDSGKYLRRRANGVFQGDLTHTLGRWQQSLGATVRDGMFDDDDNTAAKRLGGVGLWHASLRYQVDRDWALALRVDNLTDRRYQTAWGYNQARRQWFLTLSYSQAKPTP